MSYQGLNISLGNFIISKYGSQSDTIKWDHEHGGDKYIYIYIYIYMLCMYAYMWVYKFLIRIKEIIKRIDNEYIIAYFDHILCYYITTWWHQNPLSIESLTLVTMGWSYANERHKGCHDLVLVVLDGITKMLPPISQIFYV